MSNLWNEGPQGTHPSYIGLVPWSFVQAANLVDMLDGIAPRGVRHIPICKTCQGNPQPNTTCIGCKQKGTP